MNQVRASIHSYIDRTDAKAWLIQARLVVVAVVASEARKQSRAVAAKKRRALALATTRHSIVKVRSKYRCRLCRQQRVNIWAARWLESPCKILRPLAFHRSHCYDMYRGLHFCWRCGGFGSQRLRLLVEPFKPPSRAGSLVIRRMASHRGSHMAWQLGLMKDNDVSDVFAVSIGRGSIFSVSLVVAHYQCVLAAFGLCRCPQELRGWFMIT